MKQWCELNEHRLNALIKARDAGFLDIKITPENSNLSKNCIMIDLYHGKIFLTSRERFQHAETPLYKMVQHYLKTFIKQNPHFYTHSFGVEKFIEFGNYYIPLEDLGGPVLSKSDYHLMPKDQENELIPLRDVFSLLGKEPIEYLDIKTGWNDIDELKPSELINTRNFRIPKHILNINGRTVYPVKRWTEHQVLYQASITEEKLYRNLSKKFYTDQELQVIFDRNLVYTTIEEARHIASAMLGATNVL